MNEKNEFLDDLERIGWERHDITIVVGDALSEFGARLQEDLLFLGVTTSILLSGNGTAALLFPTDSMRHTGQSARVLVAVYSRRELEAQAKHMQTQVEALDGNLLQFFVVMSWIVPVLVLVHDGSLPTILKDRVAHIDVYREEGTPKGNLELIQGILQLSAPHIGVEREIDKRILELRRRIAAEISTSLKPHSIGVMVFGPAKPRDADWDSEPHLLWELRESVRQGLERQKVFTFYGEDLTGIGQGIQATLNVELKEKLCAESVDLIVVVSGSMGSAAEIGVLAQYEEVCRKTVLVVGRAYSSGFVRQGPVETAIQFGARVIDYEVDELRTGLLAERVLMEVRRVLELRANRALRARNNGA